MARGRKKPSEPASNPNLVPPEKTASTVTGTNADYDPKTGKVRTPGLLRDRSVLNVEAYIDPEEGKAYKFGSPDPRFVARNRRVGWTPARDKDGKPLPSVGGQVLLEMPKEERDNYKEGFHEEAEIMSRRYKADEVAKKDPRMFGKETRWI